MTKVQIPNQYWISEDCSMASRNNLGNCWLSACYWHGMMMIGNSWKVEFLPPPWTTKVVSLEDSFTFWAICPLFVCKRKWLRNVQFFCLVHVHGIMIRKESLLVIIILINIINYQECGTFVSKLCIPPLPLLPCSSLRSRPIYILI